VRATLRKRDQPVTCSPSDLCAGCRSLEAIELDGERPYVRCESMVPRTWLLRRLI
jgi:hypothetical protein